jgi:hypothetical protein
MSRTDAQNGVEIIFKLIDIKKYTETKAIRAKIRNEGLKPN